MDYKAAVVVTSMANTNVKRADEQSPPYSQKLLLHSYHGVKTWSYNSDHMTLPALDKIHVEVTPDANNRLDKVAVTVEVVGYRL